jgi:hypothetical protein
MRLKPLDQQFGSVVVEDLHVVDASQSPQHLSSFVGRDDGAVWAFDATGTSVGVDRDDEVVALGAGKL